MCCFNSISISSGWTCHLVVPVFSFFARPFQSYATVDQILAFPEKFLISGKTCRAGRSEWCKINKKTSCEERNISTKMTCDPIHPILWIKDNLCKWYDCLWRSQLSCHLSFRTNVPSWRNWLFSVTERITGVKYKTPACPSFNVSNSH